MTIDTHKITGIIAKELGIEEAKVRSTMKLLDDGATVPFISRYRKEATGMLDEVAIANIQKLQKKYIAQNERKIAILKSIEEQGKLTDALKHKIISCYDNTELEDLYLPYKRKKMTKAAKAREAGLEPLANIILRQVNQDIKHLAKSMICESYPNLHEVINGALDIVAEIISEDEKIRDRCRTIFRNEAIITSKVVKSKAEDASKYKDYFQFEEKLSKCPSHRYLAITRGQNEGLLRVNLHIDDEKIIRLINQKYVSPSGAHAQFLAQASEDSYKRLIAPAMETQTHQFYKEKSDLEAINVFRINLKQLLLAPPLGQKTILAIDPGFRTGCKCVVLDRNGNLKYETVIYPHPPHSKIHETKETISHIIKKYNVEAIAIGNGTAGRETEALLSGFVHEVSLFLVNEDGASIYSASDIAREEFPKEDITVRGAISIGRRLMDPLAELVKIDAKSLGIGQYQHDVNQTMLKESLDEVVVLAVNSVGVNINTASAHILTYISGLGKVIGSNIVQYRQENGDFKSINDLLKVPRLGAKAYEQSAGFLRIKNGNNILDNTGVHPESYSVVERMAKDNKVTVAQLVAEPSLLRQIHLESYITPTIGLPTLKDILTELSKPGLDPRGEAISFSFDGRVKSIEDLREGMILAGKITNMTNFGAFVDIGTKQNGLIHISQITDKFIKSPAEVLSIDQQVNVRVMDIDIPRGRINLSMKGL